MDIRNHRTGFLSSNNYDDVIRYVIPFYVDPMVFHLRYKIQIYVLLIFGNTVLGVESLRAGYPSSYKSLVRFKIDGFERDVNI